MVKEAIGEFEVVRECQEWQKMRELEERIQEMSDQTNSGVSEKLLLSLEERLANRFESTISELAASLERTDAKIDMLAPLTQSLSLSHIDTRRDIDRLGAEILEMQYPEDSFLSTVGDAMASLDWGLKEMQKKVDGALAPFMQSFAFAQMDVKARLDSIDDAKLRERLDILSDSDSVVKTKLQRLEEHLQELAAVSAKHRESAIHNSIPACLLDTAPQEDIRQVYQTAAGQEACDSPQGGGLTPFEQALAGGSVGPKRTKTGRPVSQGRCSDKEATKQEGAGGGKSSSKKVHRGEKLHGTEWGDALSVPFAQTSKSTIGFRTLERASGARSLPYLPPMF